MTGHTDACIGYVKYQSGVDLLTHNVSQVICGPKKAHLQCRLLGAIGGTRDLGHHARIGAELRPRSHGRPGAAFGLATIRKRTSSKRQETL